MYAGFGKPSSEPQPVSKPASKEPAIDKTQPINTAAVREEYAKTAPANDKSNDPTKPSPPNGIASGTKGFELKGES